MKFEAFATPGHTKGGFCYYYAPGKVVLPVILFSANLSDAPICREAAIAH